MFNVETGVSVVTVFLQGILSFFSPCILPLLPLYISYFAGGAKEVDEAGNIHYPRKKVLLNTLFFVLGISVTFFLLGFGFTAVGNFLSNQRIWFARFSGIIMILFGLYQLGFFGNSKVLGKERRLSFTAKTESLGPIGALVLGFTFSFAWTPCVGPILGSVLLMAGSSGTSIKAFVLIGVYTLGFILPFLAVGLFTGTVLDFFKRNQKIVKYTVKIGAILLIFMGLMTLTGFMNGITSYLSDMGPTENKKVEKTDNKDEPVKEEQVEEMEEKKEESKEELQDAIDFTLVDQFGTTHTLSDYKGKTIFLNFWATWCPPCKKEMPDIQALYEKYNENKEEVIVLGVAGPNSGNEGNTEHIKGFLQENGYTFPVVMDESGELFRQYGIRAFPTTFMINKEGKVYGYVESALTAEIMESIVLQTVEGSEK